MTTETTWQEAHETHDRTGTFGCPFCLNIQRARATKPPKGAALSDIRAWDKRMQEAYLANEAMKR